MIHEDIIVSGSVKIKGTFTLPSGNVAVREGLTGVTTGSVFIEYSPSGSQALIFTGATGSLDGWEVIGEQVEIPTGFFYRNIINYGYIAGGYKDASPWRNVHKTVVATDQTTHLGQLLAYPANYTSGAVSKTIFYVWSINTDNAHKGPTDIQSTTTGAVNMVTDTAYANQPSHNLVVAARSDCGTMHQETEFAWIFAGGTTAVDKFNLTTETMLSNQNLTTIGPGTAGAAAFSDENYGYGWVESAGNKLAFNTDTFSTATVWGNSGQQKGISSKLGKGYCGNEGTYNGGYNLRRWMHATDTNAGNVVKPHPNCGEENFTLGQDWQYMLGNYDGAQNNISWKLTYATDTGTTAVPGLAPGVNAGTSSGHCGWRS